MGTFRDFFLKLYARACSLWKRFFVSVKIFIATARIRGTEYSAEWKEKNKNFYKTTRQRIQEKVAQVKKRKNPFKKAKNVPSSFIVFDKEKTKKDAETLRNTKVTVVYSAQNADLQPRRQTLKRRLTKKLSNFFHIEWKWRRQREENSEADVRPRSFQRTPRGAWRRHPLWITFREVTIGSMTVAIMLGLAFSSAALYMYVYDTPNAQEITQTTIDETTIIFDRTGEHILYEIHGEENRKIIPPEEIPDFARVATIAAEDGSFYSHYGIDPVSIVRAVKVNYEDKETSQGASTITQQLVRNIFLSREKTYQRKFKEMVLAVKMEQYYSKDEILDMYLNQVPYGSNAYGIQSAAEIFFGKEATELTFSECVFLSALPNAPTYYSPYGNNKIELALRYREILNRVEELGLADPGLIAEARNTNVFANLRPFEQEILAPHFVFYVREELERLYGPEMVERGGFRVYTTLDLELQEIAEDVVKRGVLANAPYRAENAALVALDPKTGEILAMVGSNEFYSETIDGQVNVSVRPRQPGSSFKPFAYAAAFEKGFQPETYLYDVRTDFGPDGSGKNYIPGNYDNKYMGRVTMRDALANSLNVPAVKTLYLAGIQNTLTFSERLGIKFHSDKSRFGLALVLGGAEVTLLDETAGYGVFANDGRRAPAHPVGRIEASGETIFEARTISERVIDPEVARKVSSVLADNNARAKVFGPNSNLYIPERPVAVKTGTTQNYRDAWTVGYTPNLSVGVWVGNNDNRPMRAGSAGIFVAAPIWKEYMQRVLDKFPQESFVAYSGEVPSRGTIAGAADSRDDDSFFPSDSILRLAGRGGFKDELSALPKSDPMFKRWSASINKDKEKKEKEKKDKDKDDDDDD